MDQFEALSTQLRQNGQHWFECAGQGEGAFYIIINIHVTTYSWRGHRRAEHPAIFWMADMFYVSDCSADTPKAFFSSHENMII